MTCAKFVGMEGFTLTPSSEEEEEEKVPVFSAVRTLSEFYSLMS